METKIYKVTSPDNRPKCVLSAFHEAGMNLGLLLVTEDDFGYADVDSDNKARLEDQGFTLEEVTGSTLSELKGMKSMRTHI